MRVGVQTKGILDEYITGKRIEEGCRMIKNAGFDWVDFNLDVFLKNADVYKGRINSFFEKNENELKIFFKPYKEAMEAAGIKPSQMHAPYPVKIMGKDAQNKFMVEQVIPKSIMIAGYLDIPYVVIHPIKLQYIANREIEHRENLEYFASLIPIARKYNVVVCMEDLYEGMGRRIVEGPCSNPEEALMYLDKLNAIAGEERFGMCLDTGHMNLVNRRPAEVIKKLGSYIKIMHIHDNDAVGDLHQMPYSFIGEDGIGTGLDWEELINALKSIKYEGVLSFETFPCMNSFPMKASESVLAMIASIGRYIAEEIG